MKEKKNEEKLIKRYYIEISEMSTRLQKRVVHCKKKRALIEQHGEKGAGTTEA